MTPLTRNVIGILFIVLGLLGLVLPHSGYRLAGCWREPVGKIAFLAQDALF